MKKAKWRTCKITAALLTVLMLMSMAGEIPLLSVSAEEPGGYATIAGINGATVGVTLREADPSTLDDYRTVLDLEGEDGSRYAGRLWTDKSVFANGYEDQGDRKERWENGTLTLEESLDGVNDSIVASDADFLHVYSALGSSENIQITTPVNLVIVIDNSGSMYTNDYVSEDMAKLNGGAGLKFSDTRIYKTVDAVNRAVDSIMEANSYNQVAVVAFGDNGINNSASTILPMAHYTPKAGGEFYNEFIYAAWSTKNPWNSDSPQKTDKDAQITSQSGGYICVNPEVARTHGLGSKCYANGNTNIHAGIYQGMQELMNAESTATVLGKKVDRIPFLVVLTDGQTTDALKIQSESNGSWANPQGDYDNSSITGLKPGQNNGYANNFTNMLNSFTGARTDNKDGDKSYSATWSGFIKVNNDVNKKNVFGQSFKYQEYLEFTGTVDDFTKAMANDNNDLTTAKRDADAGEGEKPDTSYLYDNLGSSLNDDTTKARLKAVFPGLPDAYFSGAGDSKQEAHYNYCWPTVNGHNELVKLSENYQQTEEYQIINTLLTAAYYKEAVNQKYGTKEDDTFEIYTISVDMPDTNGTMDATKSDTTESTSESTSPKNNDNMISTNGPMMNPEDCLSEDWLKNSKYISHENAIIYPEHSVAYDVVTAIQKTIEDIDKILTQKENVNLNYIPLSNGQGIAGEDSSGTIHTNDFTTDAEVEEKYKNTAYSGVNSRLKYRRQIIYAASNPDQASYWEVSDAQTYTLKPLPEDAKSAENPYGLTNAEVKANINYPTEAYYANSSDEAADSIQAVFDQIVDQMEVPIFTPVAGSNDLYAQTGSNSVTFKDSIGKYMEVKNVKNVVLFGTNYAVEKGEEVPEGTTTYKISGVNVDELRLNPAYANMSEYANWEEAKSEIEKEGDGYKDHPGVYKLSDITIRVENENSNPTGSEQTLWVDVPVNALPLRTVSISGTTDSLIYKTNLQRDEKTYPVDKKLSDPYYASFPLRVFYTVGIVDDIKKEDGTIDVSKISSDYLKERKVTKETKDDRKLEVDDIEFFSNYYNSEKKNYKYPGYETEEGSGFPYGDTEASFSPSNENRYYVFQEAIPLYSISSTDKLDDGIIQNGIEVTEDGDGILSGDEIKGAISRANLGDASLVADGGSMDANSWYFVVIQYFVPDGANGKVKYTAIPRKGSEFGVGNPGGNYLCWYNADESSYGETKEYTGAGSRPDSGENWVIAVRKGGLRSGVLARNAKQKSSSAAPVATYSDGNVTCTADYYYVPTIGSTPHDTDTVPAVDVFLGNNGRLVIRNIKTEETPGEGENVKIGSEIKYKIHWEGNTSGGSYVKVVDPLDKGVDFVSAKFDGISNVSITAENNSNSGTATIGEAKVPVTISYDSAKHTVTWELGTESDKQVPAAASGDVMLTVKVNKDAIKTWYYNEGENSGKDGTDEDHVVKNRAQIEVNENSYFTNEVDNPTNEKTEVIPGDGEPVGVGDPIEYNIHWENDRGQDSIVTVTDPLDIGVDFVSANYRNIEITAEETSAEGSVEFSPHQETPVKISYDSTTHTVTWTIGDENNKVPATVGDNVSLNVKVNEKAIQKWTYDEGKNSGTQGEGEDFEVLNRAQVEIDNHATYTNTVENPLESKTEEMPGAGKLVGIGEEITYKIHWEADLNQDSFVEIVDPLDMGVDFVSAKYENGDKSVEITTDYYDKTESIKFGDESVPVPVHIKYDAGKHAVTWTFGTSTGKEVPSGTSGEVTLVVRVNENAAQTWTYYDEWNKGTEGEGKDYEVRNRARVQVNNSSRFTNEVENPVPDKEEVTPGDGEGVLVGEEIDYKIHWENDRDKESIVTVTDPLDPGVDFVSAEYRGTKIEAKPDSPDQQVTDSGTVAYGVPGEDTPVTITYDPKSHTVTWVIGTKEHPVPVGMRDNVDLKVKVNENAVKKWTYDPKNNQGQSGDGDDYEVLNRAEVKIDERATYTNTVENPLESKTETDPGAGKLVGIGDQIEYKIHWEADLNQDSFVEIVDPLDKGVDFVSASYSSVTATADHYDNTDVVDVGGKTIPVHIKYDSGKHEVTWTFGSNTGNADVDKKVPAGTSGEVTLVVRVNENAAQGWKYNEDNVTGKEVDDKDYEVRNRARVQVNNSSRFTNEVENPVPDKDEATPGDGKGVSIGEEITYHVHWEGDRNEESVVTVTDPLDQGVDFKEAGYASVGINVNTPSASGTVEIGETENIPVTISYNADSHTVIWTIGDEAEGGVKVPAGASGDVTLVVRVNENAKQTWDYEDNDKSGKPGEGNDFEVYNRAHVQVNNEGGFTKKVENPLESKEETDPGEGLPVGIGDEITYQIHWEADENLDSVIKIVDSLDEGVDFVKASFGKMVLSDGTEIEEQNYTVPKIVFYDLSRTVNWTIGSEEEDGVKVPAGASGSVTLVVRVNEKALKTWAYDETENSGAPGNGEDYEVLNRAQIDVNNNSVFTNVVENPIPEKTEVDPGDGENVGVGKEITYHVHWEGNPKEESYVTVSDPLDQGVDFVSAAFENISDVNITAESTEANGIAVIDSIKGIPVSISYDSALHIVTWTIGAKDGNKVPAGATGDVTLVVKVNEDAVKKWSYLEGNGEDYNKGQFDEGVDNEVVNRAWVEVNDHGAFTNTVENPLGPEKSEVSPGDGETVGLGDVITYEIAWNNYEEEAADVIITDKLDPGVDFLSASADGVTLENGELPEKPEKADLTISLVGYFKNPIEFILKLTAPDGEELSDEGYEWKSDAEGRNGIWTEDNNVIELSSDETVTVEGLPVGTEYSITVGEGENAKDIVKGAKLGAYGSVVKIKTAGGDATPEPEDIEASPSPVAEPTPEPEQTPEPEPTPEVSSEPEDNPAGDSVEGDVPETEEPTAEPSEEPVEDTTPVPTTMPAEESPSESAAESIPEEEVPQDEGQEPSESEPAPDAEEESQPSEENFAARAVAYFGKLFRNVRTKGTLSTVNPVMTTDETEAIEEDPQTDSEAEITESEPAADETISNPEDTETAEASPEPETSEENSQVDAEENSEAEDPETVLPEESTEPETMSTPEPTSTPDDEPAADPEDESPAEAEVEPSAEPSAEPEADPETDPETVPEEEPEADPETDVEAEPEEEPEDSPETDEAPEGEETDYDLIAEVTDNPVPIAQNPGDSETGNSPENGPNDGSGFVFDKDSKTATLNGESTEISISSPSGDIHIYYFAKAHTVVWVLEQQDTGSSGEVYLSVQVNKDADKLWNYDNPELPPSDSGTDHLVHNKAGVKVGHNPEQETNTVHNPTEPNKTETSINGSDVSQDLVLDESDGTVEGPGVNVGDTITYRIDWMNDATDESGEFVPSRTVVIDTLDPDVDFVWADNGGTYYKDGGTLPAKDGYDEIQIPPHSVVWDLGEQEALAKGMLELTVRVRESALQKGEVENSATVMVGNTPKQTNRVKNPVVEDGSLIVRKTVTGMGDRNKDWHFRVELSDKSINGTYGEMTFTDGVAEFTLKHGESKTATGLPLGTTYAVTEVEANQDGYFTSSTGETGTITGDGSAHADFVNSTGLPPDFPPAYPPTTTPPTTFIPTPTPEPTPTPFPPVTSPPTPTEPPAPPEPPTDTPPTGDGRDIIPWLAACGISALGIVITSRLMKKSKCGKSRR